MDLPSVHDFTHNMNTVKKNKRIQNLKDLSNAKEAI